MRPIGLMIASALIASSLAAASWKEYHQPQFGFVVEFPADPSASTGNYKTTLVPATASHNLSLKEDNAHYVATVVDLPDRKEEGAILLGEAEFYLRQLGDVTSTSMSRVEPGRAAIFGRLSLSIAGAHEFPNNCPDRRRPVASGSRT